jgi:hypothetical protein
MTMKQAPQGWRFYALSICVAAIPFAFALVRAVQTGYDLRYFWVALASLLGAMATTAVGRAHAKRPIAVVALVSGVFVIATLLAVLAAVMIGTTLANNRRRSAFGFCFAVTRCSMNAPRTLIQASPVCPARVL